MYRVLIVDDEILIRKRIMYGFDWQELGYTIAADTGSGIAALKILEDSYFDLAIVDIAMPGMTGIELAKQIREKNIKTEIIFLTGHSDFNYAREAVKTGVYSYLLKPINEDEFIETLTKLSEKLMKNQTINDKLSNLQKNQEDMDDFLNNKLITDILHDQLDKETKTKISNSLLGHFEYELWVFKFINKEHLSDISRTKKIILDNMDISNIKSSALFIDIVNNDFIIFLNKSLNEKICFEKFTLLLKEKFGHDIKIGISQKFVGEANIKKAYKESIITIKNLLLTDDCILSYRQSEQNNKSTYVISSMYKRELILSIESNNVELMKKVISTIMKEIKDKKTNYYEFFRVIMQIITTVTEITSDSKMEIDTFIGEYRSIDDALINFKNLTEIESWLNSCIEEIIKSREELSKGGYKKDIVRNAQKYIQENYTDTNLSLASLAKKLFVTGAYLSACFKKSVGISTIQYITTIRLEKAKEILLADENIEIYEIAKKVGYNDEYYFSRCFKKHFGVSPLNFKKTNLF